MNRTKLFALLAAAALFTALTACGGSDSSTAAAPEAPASATEAGEKEAAEEDGVAEATGDPTEEESAALATGKHTVEIAVAEYGTITVELDADSAPITVTNFLNLAESGFYDGLTFHRIMEGFMMQGGDPTGTGMGGAEEAITGEFASNGIDNPLSHTRGAISMARQDGQPNSATSQFFIVHQDSLFLDGEYAAFGYVTDGIEIVDAICADAIVQDGNGTVLAADQPVIESIKIV